MWTAVFMHLDIMTPLGVRPDWSNTQTDDVVCDAMREEEEGGVIEALTACCQIMGPLSSSDGQGGRGTERQKGLAH
jgi:hypothetical protein